jgi:hypothetical protein
MATKAQAGAKGTKTPAVKPMMTDTGIQAKTGKGWDYWFPALDKAGAATLDHRAAGPDDRGVLRARAASAP